MWGKSNRIVAIFLLSLLAGGGGEVGLGGEPDAGPEGKLDAKPEGGPDAGPGREHDAKRQRGPEAELRAPKVPEEYWELTENAINFFTRYSPHRIKADLPSDTARFREERRQQLEGELRRLSRTSSEALTRARRSTTSKADAE